MNSQSSAKGRRGRNRAFAPVLGAVDLAAPDPVERQVYRLMRQGLMSGMVEPGTTLTSRSLAQQFGTSVQPVRDALKRLEADGVFEGRPQSGFHLRVPTASEFRELLEIRQRLEGLAGRHAATNVSAETIRTLRASNRQMGRLGRTHDYLEENYHFHFTIYAEAERPALLAMIENLWVRTGPALHHNPTIRDRASALATHDAVIEGLVRRDGNATEAAIVRDLEMAAEAMICREGSHSAPESVPISGASHCGLALTARTARPYSDTTEYAPAWTARRADRRH
ncbi:GntR family transcriptional regulator [Mesorhizobium sp. CO1-1-8]|uniref:GntR family transcriptional regulator n=1 Tax=Mesorhizobium sp. CO1-1-8 TaxID=2876631 RepID=UPI001CD134FE|nr:GntR family transcriptional regulator [Mesorhizobium sp. CO1-1-8]MBZ9772217.1 GntR family transcriptional regulator [Mesorhizobium sp. CO1-1-8]